MKSIFKTRKRGIIAILTLCILLEICGFHAYAYMADETIFGTEETTQEQVPAMAMRCSNGRPVSPVKCTSSWLSNNGINDPEAYKREYVSNGSSFDIYRDTSNNNALWLGDKSRDRWIPCA